MTDLVTGEAVELEMRLAKLASRGLALALDILVQMGLLIAGVLVLSGTALFVDDALATAIRLVFYVLVIVGYPVAFETFTRGRSLEKRCTFTKALLSGDLAPAAPLLCNPFVPNPSRRHRFKECVNSSNSCTAMASKFIWKGVD